MPSARRRTNASGQVYYEIRVSRGRGKAYLSRRWYAPDGWSQKAIDKELAKVAAEFEKAVQSGEVISRQEQREQAERDALEASKILTLKEYAERVFIPSKTVTMSENSRSSYQGNLDNWIYPALGDFKMEEITPAQISAFLLDIQAQGKSHATAVKVYTILQGVFKMAFMSDMIPANPMYKVSRPSPRKDEVKATDPDSYTAAEVQRIYTALDSESLKWKALVYVLIDTGLRRGECCGLKWSDIDFTTGAASITGNLCYTPQKGVYLDTPKNKRQRTVYLGAPTLALLKKLRSEQADKALSAFVFTQEGSNKPMHPQSPTRYFKSFGRRHDIPDFHPHKLRHTFASIAITNGADVASVSEVLGHSDKAVTLRMYTHADADSMSRAAAVVREAIKNAGQA